MRRGPRATRVILDPVVTEVIDAASRPDARERAHRAPTEPPVRLLLVEHDSVMLIGLRAVYAAARHCEVVSEAVCADESITEARIHRPDVAVIDGDVPGGSALVISRLIRADNPHTQIVMLASSAAPPVIAAAVQAGVRGYLVKHTTPEQLVSAAETVASGGVYFDQDLIASLRVWIQDGQPGNDPLARLSQQERKILLLVAEGKTNRAIATELTLSESTVKTYVSAALRKLGLASRAEAAAFITRRESLGAG